MSLRSNIEGQLYDMAQQAALKSHERNHHKLHAHRDGTLNWFECINCSDDVIDRGAEEFQAVPRLITVGTGSFPCDCTFCSNGCHPADAVNEFGWDDLTQHMEDMLGFIPIGYFDDEN